MKKIFFTGKTGFIGQNILPLLEYDVYAPSRSELDLTDSLKVRNFLQENKFDCIIHCATPTGQSGVDNEEKIFERSLRVFMSLYHCEGMYGKLIYLGSGAEYGKHRDICSIKEEQIGEELPVDPYGLSRYTMNCLKRKDIVNLRLFGCYGKFDPPHKFITHCLNRIKHNLPVSVYRECIFDYLYVKDLAKIFAYFIENDTQYNDYNTTSGTRFKLTEIAEICCEITGYDKKNIDIIFPGMNPEYTASNQRLLEEMKTWQPTNFYDGIGDML